jgi:leader peptidase (prepilin peptidase)/N-methyltransferase
MSIFIISIIAGVFGLILGSFAGATVWRLRARQLLADKNAGEPYDKAEYKRLLPLTNASLRSDRSRCLHCGHTLVWYDLLPLVSWISTSGRCRYCHKPIGRFEPIIEVVMACAFGLFTFHWLSIHGLTPLSVSILILWLGAITMLGILFAYDQRWFLLPDVVMFSLIGVSLVIAALTFILIGGGISGADIATTLGSVVILGGLYLMLWLVSKGQWVGFGDVKLGVALGILLADWELAFLALFLANLVGTLIVLPGLLRGTLSRKTQVPFGPLLIIGFALSLLFGHAVIAWYQQLSLSFIGL